MTALRILAMNEMEFGGWVGQREAFRQVALPAHVRAALPQRAAISAVGPDGVGQINIRGPLSKDRDLEAEYWGVQYTQYEQIVQAAEALAADATVRGVLLNIDSPGGDAVGVSLAADAIAALRARKPVVAVADAMMGSAAYFLAAQATRIVAGVDAMVGSIGTFAAVIDVADALAKWGIKFEIFRTAELKGTGNGLEHLSDGQRAYLQDHIDTYGRLFKAAVMRGRGRSSDWVETVATGRTWVGQQAVDNGLADVVGTPADALRELRQMVGAGGPVTMVNQAGELEQPMSEQQTVMPSPAPAVAAIAASPPAAVTAAIGLVELKAALPGASAEFLVLALESGWTLEQAGREYMALQAREIAALRSSSTPAPVKPPAAAGGPIGSAPAVTTAASAAGSAGGDESERYREEFRGSADLRAEFPTENDYVAFRRHEQRQLQRAG